MSAELSISECAQGNQKVFTYKLSCIYIYQNVQMIKRCLRTNTYCSDEVFECGEHPKQYNTMSCFCSSCGVNRMQIRTSLALNA